jgi:hypothetical protein
VSEAIFTIFLVAVLGSLTVPATMLVLARIGYFEPIRFDLFGRTWSFAPKMGIAASYSNAATAVLSARQAAFASVVTVALTVGTPNFDMNQSDSVSTRSTASGLLKTV